MFSATTFIFKRVLYAIQYQYIEQLTIIILESVDNCKLVNREELVKDKR